MDLQSYINENRGGATRLSSVLDIPLSYLSQMATGDRSVSPERAYSIEKATSGQVTRQNLRPDDFWRIWPDLAHLAPAVTSATEGT